MAKPERIDFVVMSLSDSPRLTVLKSRYNRYVGRLNMVIVGQLTRGPEEEEMLVQVKYLREQIDLYG